MGKQRLKIISRVLEKVKFDSPETIKFIEDCLEQEFSKENLTVEEVFFLFTCLETNS